MEKKLFHITSFLAVIFFAGINLDISISSIERNVVEMPFLQASLSEANLDFLPIENVKQIAAGGNHTCIITAGGGVQCWGWNYASQLGDGTQIDRSSPVNVIGLSDGVSAIAAGDSGACALLNTGGVKCWGANTVALSGNTILRLDSFTAADVTGLESGVASITAGRAHTCVLMINNAVKCWGNNSHGQLGNGTRVNSTIPVDVLVGVDGAKAVVAGYDHTCLITSLGGVRCWGSNSGGQLGNGLSDDQSIPIDVSTLTTQATAIAAGDTHTCALTIDTGMKCWGRGEFGQLGNGTIVQNLTPFDVIGLTSGVKLLAAGKTHTCAVMLSGAAKCWGYNYFGELGDNSFTNRLEPVEVVNLNDSVNTIAVGNEHTCAIVNNGRVKCWGWNRKGQLGNGKFSEQITPRDVINLTNNATALTSGSKHICAALQDGGVTCWGANDGGQLGDGTFIKRTYPIKTVEFSNTVTSLASGYLHTCALTVDHHLKCWGANGYGQLGNGNTTSVSIPIDILAPSTNVLQIAAGGNHTCAIINDGQLQCWGDNFWGQLGDNSNINRAIPVDVSGLSSGVVGIAAGIDHTCALLESGKIRCWGRNDHGQIGGSSSDLAIWTPVDVTGITETIITISAGGLQTCALTSGGGVLCWGNSFGNTPAYIVGLYFGVRSIAIGSEHECIVKVNGSVKCWGGNSAGQLGDGTTNLQRTPVDVLGLGSGVTSIAAGESHSCALMTTGNIKCWGRNEEGQLGNDSAWSTLPVDVIDPYGPTETSTLIPVSSNTPTITLTPTSTSTPASTSTNSPTSPSTSTQESTSTATVTPSLSANSDLPDLTISSMNIQLATGGSCNFTSTQLGIRLLVANIGNANAGVFVVEVNGVRQTVNEGLAQGATKELWFAGHSGSNNAIVDVTGLIAESNENNNFLTQSPPIPTLPPTCTPTATASHTPTKTVTLSRTPTPTPTFTITKTNTKTPTKNITPTFTATPNGQGDPYENDDSCSLARAIPTDGSIQEHSFHQNADEDWVSFEVVAGESYRVEGRVPPLSPVDLVLEPHHSCTGSAEPAQNYTFSLDVVLDWKADATGTVYMKIFNDRVSQFGAQAIYHLSVRHLERYKAGALIIIAGRKSENDSLQSNIHFLSNRVYQLWHSRGYAADRIRYLATDLSLDADGDGTDDVYNLPSKANVQSSIVEWAKAMLKADEPLTIYMVDHGDYDKLYLDGPRNQLLTPADLDQWLDQLEAAIPGIKINVIIEACRSGSFIDLQQSISSPNRVIISSTSAQQDAYVSARGAFFSDKLLDSLAQGRTLQAAFEEAKWYAQVQRKEQTAWIDDNGDGQPNGVSDGRIAIARGFGLPDRLGDNESPPFQWEPFVSQTEIRNGNSRSSSRQEIWAEVRDDKAVQSVFAVIYPPSYQPPDSTDELLAAPPPLSLQDRGTGWFAATYGEFDEIGVYRILVYAEDVDGLRSRLVETKVTVGNRVYLPLVTR